MAVLPRRNRKFLVTAFVLLLAVAGLLANAVLVSRQEAAGQAAGETGRGPTGSSCGGWRRRSEDPQRTAASLLAFTSSR
ncbi:hypothetical protein FXF51_39650 [Nonomuraea sp. PA05]|uniref:hypothetical protein n=1 Tax=Nonomuraea sp. PA05 TaxID=2604466 RepID=UPI0011D37C8A|nr:hypothetical protein [Nonomuraea sp. PA05]TYB57615.1 hypothetical protein FXF51_39650 [Nonomuraea sp. PA05]